MFYNFLGKIFIFLDFLVDQIMKFYSPSLPWHFFFFLHSLILLYASLFLPLGRHHVDSFPHFRSVEWQINNIFIAARKRYLFFWAIFQGKLFSSFLFFFLFISFSFLSLGQDNVNKIPLMVTVCFTAVHKTNDHFSIKWQKYITTVTSWGEKYICFFFFLRVCLNCFIPNFLVFLFSTFSCFFPHCLALEQVAAGLKDVDFLLYFFSLLPSYFFLLLLCLELLFTPFLSS